MLNHNSRTHLMHLIGSLGWNSYRSIKRKGKGNEKTNVYLLRGTFTKPTTSKKQVMILSAHFNVDERDQISRGLMLSTVRLLGNSAVGIGKVRNSKSLVAQQKCWLIFMNLVSSLIFKPPAGFLFKTVSFQFRCSSPSFLIPCSLGFLSLKEKTDK